MIAFTIISLALITALFLVWFFSHKSREKERLLLIEKGKDLPPQTRNFNFRFPWLKFGLLFFGISFGIIFGIWFSEQFQLQFIAIELLFISLMILFGAIGMILAHYLDKK